MRRISSGCCAGGHRPRCRAAEKADELASSHCGPLNPRTESEAIYRIRRPTERRRRWSAQVTATVGTIPITFYLVRRDAQPFAIFPPPCIDYVTAHPNLCRIAVGLIAARSRRLIGHKPSRVELLVQREIVARMRPMFLRVYRLACCDDKKRNEVPQGEPSAERNFPASGSYRRNGDSKSSVFGSDGRLVAVTCVSQGHYSG
jgi:hypothetical protein